VELNRDLMTVAADLARLNAEWEALAAQAGEAEAN